ncbi:MAG: ATP-binding protein [Defluviitaleaceae bacterium]|nr:ATP-binding protein [Defluviitaleaceae bacterium]
MKKRLFIYPTLILLLGLLSYFALSIYITQTNNMNIAKDNVMETTKILADFFDEDMDISFFVNVGQDIRITIISPEGYILSDSLPLDLYLQENRLLRPEIQAALAGTPTAYVRYSETFEVNFVYYAIKVAAADSYVFIRTALPAQRIDTYLSQSLPLLVLLIFIIALLCFLFTRGLVNRITKPFESIEQKLRSLSEGKYTQSTVAGSYEEIDAITYKIDEVALMLQSSFTALKDEKFKLEYILNNIGDGIFVVDENKNIVLINDAASRIFERGTNIVGKSLIRLSFDKALVKAVDECLEQDKNALFELNINSQIFFIAIKRLPDTSLILAALSDVTENRENAKRREEFFANASHELKTPLTAIKGFNELMSINNKDEGMDKYISGVARETDRMLILISDMLKLSELENVPNINPAPVSLSDTVSEVSEALSIAISEKSIIFETKGDAVVYTDPEHIYELVKNLIENAIRYNNQGGKVSVAIIDGKNQARLLVSDNGIGISQGEQIRIFERFYRVEKSRSERGGGTGLGLSIVKHICALYGWRLSLKSKLGYGTEITIIFGD